MSGQEEFLKSLKEFVEVAKTNDNKVAKGEIKDYFSDMHLDESQYEMIYHYLSENNIEVTGYKKEASDDNKLDQEDEKYLNRYNKDIRQINIRNKQERADLFDKFTNGDTSVKDRLIESLLRQVVTLAKQYVNQGVLIEDLIQEGNLELIYAVSAISDNEVKDPEKYIMDAVKKRMVELVDEQMEEGDMENTILAKTSLLHEATNHLAKELGRVATRKELSEYTKITEDEINDIIGISLDAVKIGEEDGL